MWKGLVAYPTSKKANPNNCMWGKKVMRNCRPSSSRARTPCPSARMRTSRTRSKQFWINCC
jgi:hypothetical protein